MPSPHAHGLGGPGGRGDEAVEGEQVEGGDGLDVGTETNDDIGPGAASRQGGVPGVGEVEEAGDEEPLGAVLLGEGVDASRAQLEGDGGVLTSARILASGDSLLVKIGSSGITVDEFQQRFELIPQIAQGGGKDIDQKKNNLLYSLIAEKLWAYEAEALKLDTSDIMQITFKTIEKMFVRDALYKIEITCKIKITDEEKLEGLKRIYSNLNLDVIYFSDSLSALKIHKLLNKWYLLSILLKVLFNQIYRQSKYSLVNFSRSRSARRLAASS